MTKKNDGADTEPHSDQKVHSEASNMLGSKNCDPTQSTQVVNAGSLKVNICANEQDAHPIGNQKRLSRRDAYELRLEEKVDQI